MTSLGSIYIPNVLRNFSKSITSVLFLLQVGILNTKSECTESTYSTNTQRKVLMKVRSTAGSNHSVCNTPTAVLPGRSASGVKGLSG